MAGKIDFGAAFGKTFDGYLRLPLLQKIIYPLLIVGSVAGILFVSKMASRPGYAVLFTDLSPADASAVIDVLKQQKVSYQLRGDGNTIAITPPNMVNELRIQLASDGIPKSGRVGLELFDITNLGTTTFQEKVKWQRAIQGELQRTIESMDGVNSARVAIAKPEKSVFAKRENETTASVLLTLRPGAELTKKQIKGITNLVAGSVEGLLPQHVTIVDSFGNLLTPDEENPEELGGAEENRLNYKQALEQSYVHRIEQMLSKVLGPNRVVARVTADLDFSLNEREEEVYDPAGQVIRSERSIEKGTGFSQRGGIPGVVSNLGDDPDVVAPPGDESKSSQKETVKNYEVSRAVSKVSAPRGKLISLSVAVVVDGTYETPAGAAADAPKVFKPLDTEMMARLESLVKSAVGYDGSRGDTVTVENIPFFAPPSPFADGWGTGEEVRTWLNWAMPYLVPFMFFLIFMAFVIKPFISYLTAPTEAEVDLTRLLPTGISELEAELDAERQRARVPEVEQVVDLDQLNEIMAENSKMVRENPEQAALLIRYWLNDGRV